MNYNVPVVFVESGLRFILVFFTSSELRLELGFLRFLDRMISLAVALRSRTGLLKNKEDIE